LDNADGNRAFSAASDAGSVTGSFTGSLGGTSVAPSEGVFAATGGKKRGRKKKADKEREDAASARGGTLDGRSTRMGSIDPDATSVRGGAVAGVGAGGDYAEEDEDLDDEGELLGREEGPTDREAEKKKLAYVCCYNPRDDLVANIVSRILVDAFNPVQSSRYDLFKRAKLRKETLRRIVNHALSQSVPASVVTTINGFTKVFAGEIIEKARTVQQEWAEAFDQAALAQWETEQAENEAKKVAEEEAKAKSKAEAVATASRSSSEAKDAGIAENQANGVKHESHSPTPVGSAGAIPPNIPIALSPAAMPVDHHSPYSSTASTGLPVNGNTTVTTTEIRREFKLPPNPHRGQLLPDHLREALRRYRRDGEGGSVGMSGLSQPMLGARGAYTWNIRTGGKSLFR
jgi:transcription initiation factor TFIID subunit 11